MGIAVYLEAGTKRTFAAAIEWPGWCRSGRGEEAALAALLGYGPRYRAALGGAAAELGFPLDLEDLEVVERLHGDATTDFGAPSIAPSADDRPLDDAEVERQLAYLEAAWAALGAAADAAQGITLRTGPRGGGRDLPGIVNHVINAEVAYLSRLGAKLPPSGDAEGVGREAVLRAAVGEAVRTRARGLPLAHPSRARSLWSPRFFIRRAAWHALDHAWEIQDRSGMERDTT